MPEQRVIAAALHLPPGRMEQPLILAWRPPRITVLQPLGSASPAIAVAGLESMAAPDVSVGLVGPTTTLLADAGRMIAARLPRAGVRRVDPGPALRFIWFYRDHHDPLAFGHACSRVLLDENFPGRPVPDIRRAAGKRTRRLAEADLRRLVREMGNGLGVAPPIPPVAPAAGGWSAVRLAGLYDSCVALFALLLERWGSPLARVAAAAGEEEFDSLELADQWLERTRDLPGEATSGAARATP